MTRRDTLLTLLFIASTMAASAKISLPQLFQPGMVVQRNQPIPVWGTAQPGARIAVDWRKHSYSTVADTLGRWRINLPKTPAGGPYEMRIAESAPRERGSEARSLAAGNDVLTLTDVLVGDVWLCSGQSNIDVTIERVYPQYGRLIDDYQNNRIRMFRVQTDADVHGPKADVKPTPIHWLPVNRNNAWTFSAVGYFLGREMYEKSGVPQGVIVNSVGGSPIQAWLDADTLRCSHPADYRRLLFYQDDQMVQSLQQANQLARSRWDSMLNATDPGMADDDGHGPLFARPDLDDSHWPQLQQTYTRADGVAQSTNLAGTNNYAGSFWARQQVVVDAAHARQPARLLVGTLFDADHTYVNGQLVGTTGYQYPPRRYQVPAGLLKEGGNTLAVRFITHSGWPHFIPEKPYKLIFDDGTELPLSPTWRLQPGSSMPTCPGADAGGQNLPSALYNGMLYPLAPYALSGVVWYQGESNTHEGDRYQQLLTQLVNGWRQRWSRPDLPFVVVQLANFMEPSAGPQQSGWSLVREAQRHVADSLPQVALAVTIDLGETVDIHPLRKREVAQRIARGFEHLLRNPRLPLSPKVLAVTCQADSIVLTLDQALLTDGPLFEFEVAAADRTFVSTEAWGRGTSIVLRSPVARPHHIRYAWKNNPIRANVYSRDSIPMSPWQRDIPAK